jgi:RNA polymerase sigma factor (sigma-70 family)
MNFSEKSLTDERSDGELLSVMNVGDELSFAALDIFYRRYAEALYRHVYRVKGLAEADRSDLVQETMMQAFRAAATFTPYDSGDPEKSRRRTIAWLGQIAARLHYQKYRRREGVEFEALEDENKATEEIENVAEKIPEGELVRKIRESENAVLKIFSAGGGTESAARKILGEVLEELPERDREILLATYEEFDLQNPKKQLSRGKIKEITEKYEITSKNLKQIRYRARKFVFVECLKRFNASEAGVSI